MLYPAQFIKDKDSDFYVVIFPEIPEALTQGKTIEEAKIYAQDALITALDFYFEDNRPIPLPPERELMEDEEYISLPLSVWAKVLLLNTMLEQKVNQSDLAKRLHKPRQEVQRIINLEHTTKIDTIVDALHALGKETKLSLI